MRKSVIAVILAAIMCAGAAYGEVIGRHTMFNMSEKDAIHVMLGKPAGTEVYVGVDVSNISLKYYDSLSALLLALGKGEVDSITVPRPVGRYVLENTTDFWLKGFNWWYDKGSATLNFGCTEDNSDLIKRINEALAAMKKDGSLALLQTTYIETYGGLDKSLVPAKFEHFDDAQTITVAITGDLPPIDYVAPDGVPAGFNVAVLAELGRRLHVNIKTVNIETGARLAALTSGRADVIFWFRGTVNVTPELSLAEKVNDKIILSEPYYYWNEQYFIGKK